MATRKNKTTRSKKSPVFNWKKPSMAGVHPMFQKIIKWSWISMMIGVALMLLLWTLVSLSKLPNTQALENPKYEIASLIYSSDGEELGRYFEKNRDWVTFEELNPYLVEALVSTEDERFFSHSGIDAKGTMRAVVYAGSKGGASTITQQLAKLFFTDRASNFIKRVWQKLKEWVIAIRFEKQYTKQEIIAMYLNKVDFLYNSHGVSAAAETYFGKKQKDLTIEEAATIIGMLKNPSLFNPKLYPERTMNRRNVVLGQMLKNDKISKKKFDQLKVVAMDMSKFKRKKNYSGLAPYFRSELTKWLKRKLEDDRYLKADGSKYNIYQDGIKIYTTIDAKMQEHAESAMLSHMTQLQDKFFRVWKGRDPWTYRADKNQKRIRSASLNRDIWNSDRYKNIRKSKMTTISNTISSSIDDVRLRDADIRRMLKEGKKAGHLADLVRRKDISRAQSKVYKKIIASPHWKDLKRDWGRFQKAVKSSFHKEKTIKVYSHNGVTKSMKMTPLDSIKYHKMFLQLGSMSIEPQSGHVKTWVGGINYDYFKYDHIQNARQVGSTFKPFIYASAIFNLGMSPCHKVKDTKYAIPANDTDFGLMETWQPDNYDDKYLESEITLKEALRLSKNTISVWLMKQLGSTELVRSLADRMGIDKKRIPNSPSICLGAADLSVMDMTGAYASFANNGIYTEPIFVTRIEDRNGKIIYSGGSDSRRSFPEDYNYVMVDMLQNATAVHSWKLKSQFGGKTGTTDEHVDGWFMGITPNLVVGTWVGGDDKWIKFNTNADGTGGKLARPFFFEFMKKVEGDKEIAFDTEARFVVPENMSIELDCDLYNANEPEEEKPVLEDEFDEEFEG